MPAADLKLLDHFAGIALGQLLAQGCPPADLGYQAYKIAQSMLRARESMLTRAAGEGWRLPDLPQGFGDGRR